MLFIVTRTEDSDGKGHWAAVRFRLDSQHTLVGGEHWLIPAIDTAEAIRKARSRRHDRRKREQTQRTNWLKGDWGGE